ncbi:hypothetical protein [Streptomyces sp. RKAG337]|uniref:hypothetical protein n=1 Tax=Streptomyces sp. RKAG337 TaxID=2893404 RepID=UPI0020347184|nr:hypothetical protein [Streptomyces sp. RKAG337]MCM2427350.1 hypothetical protein [Streptomyces sp. RKAG337]
MTDVRALSALADVICRAQEQGRVTPMGIAFAIDAAGLLMSPDTSAELDEYRRQFPKLTAGRPALPRRVDSERYYSTPSGCFHCGIGHREHAQQWTPAGGWHQWTPPTDEQVKARMLARRSARRQYARAAGGASC